MACVMCWIETGSSAFILNRNSFSLSLFSCRLDQISKFKDVLDLFFIMVKGQEIVELRLEAAIIQAALAEQPELISWA